jgi:hypothetical protein
MGSVRHCFDNSVAESFFATLQLELLEEHHWHSPGQLAKAIFVWIESDRAQLYQALGVTATYDANIRTAVLEVAPPRSAKSMWRGDLSAGATRFGSPERCRWRRSPLQLLGSIKRPSGTDAARSLVRPLWAWLDPCDRRDAVDRPVKGGDGVDS